LSFAIRYCRGSGATSTLVRIGRSFVAGVVGPEAPVDKRGEFKTREGLMFASSAINPEICLTSTCPKKSRLPAIYPFRDYVEAGGLMAYETDLAELFRRMADDVHQILNGTKPADIPIYQPTKFEFLISLKAAKELGVTIPASLLALATK
jgi:ABC transporter substrate binding protein